MNMGNIRLSFKNGIFKIERDAPPKEKSAKPYDIERFVADLIRKTQQNQIEWKNNDRYRYFFMIGEIKIEIEYLSWWHNDNFPNPTPACRITSPFKQKITMGLWQAIKKREQRKMDKIKREKSEEILAHLENLKRALEQ